MKHGRGDNETRVLTLDRQLDAHDLLAHDAQNFDVDAVELVEAGPGAARRQTFEELAHRLVVEAVATVEHDALHRYCFG